jgi:hypothetical protein
VDHLVVFRTVEGKSGYHQVEALDEAVRFVEHLRNHEGVEEARVYRLAEVALEVKPYFKVQVADQAAAPAPAPGGVATPAGAAAAPAPQPAAVGGERGLGLFGRGH